MYGAAYVEVHVFLPSALVEGEWLAPRPSHFTPGETAHSSIG